MPKTSSKAPLVPVGTAILVVKYIDNEPHVLLGKRININGGGTYSFPGGRLEPGEQPIDCAYRELEEETGLTGALKPVHQIPYAACRAGDEDWLTLFFICFVEEDDEAINFEPDKCEGWKFYPWESLPHPLYGAIDQVVESLDAFDIDACRYGVL